LERALDGGAKPGEMKVSGDEDRGGLDGGT
jgi:hypothetical protein